MSLNGRTCTEISNIECPLKLLSQSLGRWGEGPFFLYIFPVHLRNVIFHSSESLSLLVKMSLNFRLLNIVKYLSQGSLSYTLFRPRSQPVMHALTSLIQGTVSIISCDLPFILWQVHFTMVP